MAMYWKVRPRTRISVGLSASLTAYVPVLAGGFRGIPMFHALSGESVTLGLDGEIAGLTFSGQGTVAAGSFIYLVSGALSLGAGANDHLIGVCTKTKDASNLIDMKQLMPQGPGMIGGGQ